jgi:hypothetical protein
MKRIDKVPTVKVTEIMHRQMLKEIIKLFIKPKILRKNINRSNKVGKYIIIKMTQNCIKKSESIKLIYVFFRKIQNRLSARRVRGRKDNAFDSLEHEVDYLRKNNSELLLSNARL